MAVCHVHLDAGAAAVDAAKVDAIFIAESFL